MELINLISCVACYPDSRIPVGWFFQEVMARHSKVMPELVCHISEIVFARLHA